MADVTPPVVFFDLDGTLVDTTYLHTVAWSRALAEADERVPMSSIHSLIGMGGSELLRTLLDRDEESIRDAHAEYFCDLRPQATPLPGAKELLAALRDAGVKTVLVTSSKPADVEALLPILGGRHAVDEVVHGEETDRAKPEPDLFHVALDRTGIQAGDALAIGDAEWDVHTAKAAGVPTIGVGTGGTPVERLLQAGAIAVYRNCQDLLDQWSASPLPGRQSGAAQPDGVLQ